MGKFHFLLKILTFIDKRKKILSLIFLFLITFIALWLRFRLLGTKDLWLDEYFTESGAFYPLKKIFEASHTRTTLLFSVIMKVYASMICLLSHRTYLTPFELRIPNVIFGSLLVFVIYFILRKISDSVASLISSLLCAISYCLIYYSRDGRYYPFMLLCVAISLLSAIYIIDTSFDDKNQIKYHIFYMIFGFCGMLSHYGFWIFFAVSNISLCLFLVYRFFLGIKREVFIERLFKAFIYILLMAIPAFFVPAIIYQDYHSGHGNGLSSLLSFFNNDFLINNLNYKTLNAFYSDFLREFKLLQPYALSFVVVVSIILLIFNKHKNIVLYLVFVRFGTFILLRFVPRNVVPEPLRSRYILFLFLIDIILFSLFFSDSIKAFLNLLHLSKNKFKDSISLIIFAIFFVFSLLFVYFKILNYGVYKPYKTVTRYFEKLDECFRDGDIILTDFMEPHASIPYGIKLKSSRNRWKCYYIGWIDSPPSNYNRIILFTKKNVKKLPNVEYLGKISDIFINVVNIPEYCYNDDVSFLLSQIISSNEGLCSKVLNKWANRKTNIIEYLSNTDKHRSIIRNPDFSNGFLDWKIKRNGNINFSLTNMLNKTCACISGKGGWSTISQDFIIEKRKSYKAIVEIMPYNICSSNVGLAACVKNYNGKDKYFYFSGIENNNQIINSYLIFSSDDDTNFNLRIQYSNKSEDGIVFIKQIKVIELRDNKVFYPNQELINNSDELIMNGDFSNGLNNWSYNDQINLISVDNNKNCVEISGNPGHQNRLFQTISMISGHVYRLSFKSKSEIKGSFAILRDDNVGNERYLYTKPSDNWVNYSKDFICENSGKHRLFLSCKGSGLYYFTDVSLKDTTK